MGQTSYTYTTAKNGTLIGTANTVASFTNPVSAQVSLATVVGTTDGLNTLQVIDDESGETWEFSFTGSTSTAAQIAAGIVAAMDADVNFLGVAAQVAAVAAITITFANKDHSYSVAWTVASSGGSTVATTTAAGGSVLPVGIFVYISAEGEVLPAVAASAAAISGIVCEGPDAETTNGETTPAYGYPAGSTVNVLTNGQMWVKVADAVTAGAPVDFKGANGTTSIPLGTPGSAAMADGTVIPNGSAIFNGDGTALGLAKIKVNRT